MFSQQIRWLDKKGVRGSTARQPWYDVPRTVMEESGNMVRRAADPAS
jgi:hypothetical protein